MPTRPRTQQLASSKATHCVAFLTSKIIAKTPRNLSMASFGDKNER